MEENLQHEEQNFGLIKSLSVAVLQTNRQINSALLIVQIIITFQWHSHSFLDGKMFLYTLYNTQTG